MGRVNKFEGEFGRAEKERRSEIVVDADEVLQERIDQLVAMISEDPEKISEKARRDLVYIIQSFDQVHNDYLEGNVTIQSVVSSMLEVESRLKSRTAKNVYTNLMKREGEVSKILVGTFVQRMDTFEEQAQKGELDIQEIRDWSASIARDFSTSEKEMMGDEYELHVISSREWFENQGTERISAIIQTQSEVAAA